MTFWGQQVVRAFNQPDVARSSQLGLLAAAPPPPCRPSLGLPCGSSLELVCRHRGPVTARAPAPGRCISPRRAYVSPAPMGKARQHSLRVVARAVARVGGPLDGGDLVRPPDDRRAAALHPRQGHVEIGDADDEHRCAVKVTATYGGALGIALLSGAGLRSPPTPDCRPPTRGPRRCSAARARRRRPGSRRLPRGRRPPRCRCTHADAA